MHHMHKLRDVHRRDGEKRLTVRQWATVDRPGVPVLVWAVRYCTSVELCRCGYAPKGTCNVVSDS
jgi:hypothetical protein